MRITVKVKDVEIVVDEQVNNTQIKYAEVTQIHSTIKLMAEECLKLLRR